MNKNEAVRIGDWIKEQRAERGLTMATLGEYVNVAPLTLRRWEKGETGHGYIRHGLRYFFEWWDKGNPTGEIISEIPEGGKPQLATGAWLTWWLGTVGVCPRELAEKLDVTTSCVYRWMKPDTKIPLIAEYAIRQAMKDLGN